LALDGESFKQEDTSIKTCSDNCQFGDVNGDGLIDSVALGCYPAPGCGIVVQTNTGNGFGRPEEWPVLPGLGSTWDSGGGQSLKPVDLNGDGIQDFLFSRGYLDGGQSKLVILASTGTSFVTHLLPIRATASLQALDANGDGLDDLTDYDRGTRRIFQRTGGKSDVIINVSDLRGDASSLDFEAEQPTDVFEYDPLSDHDIYDASDLPACEYPQRCLRRGPWVVGKHSIDTGQQTPQTLTYQYGDARADLAGDGWLGFRWIRINDTVTNTVTIRKYDLTT
jgi:hypothetical protein